MPIEATYYTDPLCCWSWGMEPGIRKLTYEFGDQIRWRYCMGGMLPGWDRFSDPVNCVTRPIQLGPVWMHAGQVSGMPIDHTLWRRDPPASSYPACIAVKAAQLQSIEYGEKYLGLARAACMQDGVNIAKPKELLNLANALKSEYPTFDVKKFSDQFKNGEGSAAFKADMNEIRLKNISRFPTIVFRKQKTALMVTGYRPYGILIDVLTKLSPGIQKIREEICHDSQ